MLNWFVSVICTELYFNLSATYEKDLNKNWVELRVIIV